jgi:hypothetical protein
LEFSLASYLPIASFALAASGLAVRFFMPSGPAKETLIGAVLIFLILGSGALWQSDRNRMRQVREIADEIVKVVGNEKRTYEEIIGGLRQPTYQLTNTAIDLLISENRLGSEAVTITDRADKEYRIRLYFVRTF